jgi:tetraacyldisaccharide 4'-kinase
LKDLVRLDSLWYGPHPLSVLLAPLGRVFAWTAAARRRAYHSGVLHRVKLPVPVIVVGNITVGGTGKTPLVIWLVEALRAMGRRPGVVSRGYGGRASTWPQHVTADSDPAAVGDEPVLIARRCACPVVTAPQRADAARTLLAEYDCDVIVCDDGLQHYALARDLEIAVVDGARRLGNGRCLPAGPLREPPSRLRHVDLVVVNGEARAGECGMRLTGEQARALLDPSREQPLDHWRGAPVHAVAGIGNPARFFAHLRRYGLEVVEHAFPDHHRFQPGDIAFGDGRPVLMTEKDAVKCRAFAGDANWYVPVDAVPDEDCRRRLQALLARALKQTARAGALQ